MQVQKQVRTDYRRQRQGGAGGHVTPGSRPMQMTWPCYYGGPCYYGKGLKGWRENKAPSWSCQTAAEQRSDQRHQGGGKTSRRRV